MRSQSSIALAFNHFDDSSRGFLDFTQICMLLMSFGIRPSEQYIDQYMSAAELVDLNRTTEIVNAVLPVETARKKLLKAFVLKDAHEKRPIDGLLRADHLVEVLHGWKLSDAEIVDTLHGVCAADGRLDYQRLVDYLLPE